jgi:5-formyltetrahydrofolate cyclo-ligase
VVADRQSIANRRLIRQALSEAEYGQLNFQLYQNFFSNIDLSFIKVLHTFLPITSKKEVDTWLIIERIRREFPHVRISIPRVNNQTNELENFFFEGLHQLTTTEWGIQEPKQGIPTEPEKIDMVLVPLLAFDTAGNRIGYGKGYYDRFLKLCKTNAKKIGVSFFDPEENLPAEEYDTKLTNVVTPAQLYSFK